jgi:hypothetical protein
MSESNKARNFFKDRLERTINPVAWFEARF